MRLTIRFCRLSLFMGLLMAAGDAWKTKPVSQWSPEDAKQMLADSPWVKKAPITILVRRSEAQLRDGGIMGGGATRSKTQQSVAPTLVVRWESALPVRSAEPLAGEMAAPDWDGEYYAIAVYDVPGLTGSEKFLSGAMKRNAVLRRDGRKDLRPARVDAVIMPDKRVRLVYLFKRTDPIATEDRHVTFMAQIQWLTLAQDFALPDMQFQGRLEL